MRWPGSQWICIDTVTDWAVDFLSYEGGRGYIEVRVLMLKPEWPDINANAKGGSCLRSP